MEISVGSRQPGNLLGCQRRWTPEALLRQIRLRLAHDDQSLFPFALQTARHQAILGLDGVELTPCSFGFELGPLDTELEGS